MPAPVLAAPLVIPFAEAIGVSIAALGMAKATDKVNEFIQENPEQSMKIFQMIMPSQGIANALKNKSSEGDEEVSEDIDVEVEEKPKKLTGREKGMRIKEAIRRARAGRGNYSSPDAEGSAVDIRGSVIREVEDMGIADKDLKDNYDPDKPKFDYKKFFKKRYADGGAIGIEVLFEEKKPRKDFNIGGRATTQDFANALKSVSAGTTYQQQAQAKDYARQEASNLLSQAMRSGNQANIQSILQGVGGITSIPGMQFNRSGNRITSIPATGPGRDKILNAMANQMLSTTSYGGGSSAPPQKSPLQLKIEENKRLYDEYVKNNPPQIGLLPGSQGGAPTPPKPEYEDQALLSKLTMLTPEEAFAGETFDTLSDLDQYNFAQAFSQFQPQLRDSSYVSPYGAPSGRDIFSRRYGIKDGGRVGLFMGGPPLEGQALNIYNSMNAYGFDDQAIADALSAQGLYTPSGAPVVEEPVTNIAPNIINQGGGDGPPNDPPKDPYGGLGYSSANFGLGNTAINKDAVMDYEADAYEIGRTPFGQLSKFGVTALNALKNIPTPINLARMAYESYKQKQIEKKAQEEAIARDIARDMQESNRASRTGGYQAGYSSDFMDGPSGGGSTGGSPGSSGPGGSDSMGSFARGGLAAMFKNKR